MEEKKENNSNLFLMKNVNPSDTEYNESAVKADSVSFYAEYRRKTEITSDLYGGDAYPMVWSTEVQGKKLGLILVSDGMGSGSFRHNGLYEKYYTGENTTTEEESGKLYDFLSNLYGEKFFKDEQAVDYAIRSFSPRPPDSMYMTPSGKSCFKEPFYCRSSQYLASRILCVGVFYKFRKRFVEHFSEQGAWNKDLLDKFRRAIEIYIDGETNENGEICYNGKIMTAATCGNWLEAGDGEVNVNDKSMTAEIRRKWLGSSTECLRKNIWKSFDIKKDPEVAKCIYLPCTFASWWFVENEKDIDAAALYLGDSRCYKVDLKDGIKQISVDDALEGDGTMTVTQSFGFSHNIKDVVQNGKLVKTHDGSIKVTMIKADKPCALFCCSDGVYDTCPVYDERIKGMQQREPADYLKGFEYFGEVNDLAFEYNFLTILRKCNSLDDVRNMIARSFYSHAVPGGVDARGARSAVSTFKSGEESGGVKLDDSATFGIQFFSNKMGFPEIITKLRDNNNTVLDRIWKLFAGADTKGNYCTRMENMGEPETRKKDSIDKAIMDNKGGKEFIALLTNKAMELYSEVKREHKMFGVPFMGMRRDGFIASELRKHFDELIDKVNREYDDIHEKNLSGYTIIFDANVKQKLLSVKKELKVIEQEYVSTAQLKNKIAELEKEIHSIEEDILMLNSLNNTKRKERYLADANGDLEKLRAQQEEESNKLKRISGKIEELIDQDEFPFISRQAQTIKDGNNLEESVRMWLSDDSKALYIDSTDICYHIIIDDDVMIELCNIFDSHANADEREYGFVEYFKGFKNAENREKIYKNLPDYEELENYKKAKEAVENYNGLFADNVEEVKSSGNGDYHNVTLDKGRVDPE